MYRLFRLVEVEPETLLPYLSDLIESAAANQLAGLDRHPDLRRSCRDRWAARRRLVWLAEWLLRFPEFYLFAERILIPARADRDGGLREQRERDLVPELPTPPLRYPDLIRGAAGGTRTPFRCCADRRGRPALSPRAGGAADRRRPRSPNGLPTARLRSHPPAGLVASAVGRTPRDLAGHRRSSRPPRPTPEPGGRRRGG